MKKTIFLFFIVLLIFNCNNDVTNEALPSNHLEKYKWNNKLEDSLVSGSTYLSVYSQIYSITEHKKLDLTATISIRNINKRDTVFIKSANYYDTKGDLIRTYLTTPIFVKPMQTIEIVIDEKDQTGGAGANFVFDWLAPEKVNSPYFEGVMITTYGQQGLSLTTQGVEIKN
ncbi:MAG: DUF3124 domain-containing protein [Lacinutrix venerupis]